MSTIWGFVLARSGSKGFPKKNIKKIGGKTLIERAVASAVRSSKLDKVIFSSDSEEYLELIDDAFKGVPNLHLIKRPSDMADDETSIYDSVRYLLDLVVSEEENLPTHIAILQPTTPFRMASTVDNLCNLVLAKNVSSGLTIVEASYPPVWTFAIGEDERLSPLVPEGFRVSRRQDTPQYFKPAGICYVLSNELLYDLDGLLPVEDTVGLVVNKYEAINIDDESDYIFALACADAGIVNDD